MNKRPQPIRLLSLLLVLCLPVIVSCQNRSPSTRVPVPSEHPSNGPISTALPEQKRIILQSGNLSILVGDPVEALTALQQAVERAGGYVVSSSSWSSPGSAAYSSLSAKVPPESLGSLRSATVELAEEVQSDSLYSQDVTSEYRLLHKRLQGLSQAQDHV